MSERAKQNGLSAFITALGIGLLLFSRHDALTSGAYSLKLLFLGAVLIVWGPMSFVLNVRDPMTTRRAISRLTMKSSQGKQGIATTLAVLVLGVVVAAGVDYLFGIWIERDLAACKASNTCVVTLRASIGHAAVARALDGGVPEPKAWESSERRASALPTPRAPSGRRLA